MSNKVLYDDYTSCNKCNVGVNSINPVHSEPYYGVIECSTLCNDCKHEDYWASGYYIKKGNSRKYYYENGKKRYE